MTFIGGLPIKHFVPQYVIHLVFSYDIDRFNYLAPFLLMKNGSEKEPNKAKRRVINGARCDGEAGRPSLRQKVERENFQGIVASLEQTMENTCSDLRVAMDHFEELCLRISEERDVPIGIFTETRQAYKKIQDQLTKIGTARQLLEGKYRQYYRRNYQLEKEIMQIAFMAKSLYQTFEETEADRKLKGMEQHSEAQGQQIVFPWFQSKEKQVILLRNLNNLDELDYKTRFELGFERRREVIESAIRSVSLFALLGEVTLIDILQSRMRFREYDITERYKEGQFRGALTHLKEVSPSEIQNVLRRIVGTSEFLKLKCLLLRIQSQDDLKKAIVRIAEDILRMMYDGEVRVLSI